MIWIPDATALSDFRKCPEIFRLRHRLHLVPPAEPKRDAGSALHVAFDVWFRKPGSDVGAALAALRLAMEPEQPAAFMASTPTPRALPQLERIVTAYSEVYPREFDNFRVVQNESYVEKQIGKGGGQADGGQANDGAFSYCGIIDRVIEMPDGTRYVMDLKSTGARSSQAYEDLMSVSDQMIGYVALERAAGRRCDGFYIDRIYIDDRYQSVKSEHFQRLGPFSVPVWRVERWAEDVMWTLGEIRRLEEARGVDKPWPIYHNWAYGKPDPAYWAFIKQPAELHPALVAGYARDAWEPKRVAEQRQVLKLTAKIAS